MLKVHKVESEKVKSAECNVGIRDKRGVRNDELMN